MELKRPQRRFGEDTDPFKGDDLNRKAEILEITPIITASAPRAVMAIDAPWGTGKTAFVKMWAKHLNNEGGVALYFNAWETDFELDPLIPFMGEMDKELSKRKKGKTKEKWVSKWESAQGTLKTALPALAGAFVQRVAGNEFVDVAKQLAGEAFNNYGENISELEKFREALRQFVDSTDTKRVVVFVDELDRCRPDYAVKVLERIKHLFEETGLMFILALDREQLCHSIKGLYGAGLDADIYLRRFIDFNYTMLKPDMSAFLKSLVKDLGMTAIFNKRATNPELASEKTHFLDALALLAQACGFSLRDMEHLVLRANIVLVAAEKSNEYIRAHLLALLIAVRHDNPYVYNNFIRPGNSAWGMMDYWDTKLEQAGVFGHPPHVTAASRIASRLLLGKGVTAEVFEQTRGHLYENAETFAEGKKEYARQIKDDLYSDTWGPYTMTYLVEKIEMAGRFQIR